MSLIKRDTNYDAARGIDTVGAIARQSAANTKQKEEKEKQMSGYTKIGAPPAAASVVSPELLSRIPGTMAYRAAHAKQGGMPRIPSYDEGTDSVPEDQVALIHEGEKIVPANENPDNKQPLIAAAPADKSVQAPHPATEPESMQSTQQLIQDSPEEKAIDVDKKSAMGQGSNGFVKLGTALIHEKALGLGDDEFRPTMSEDAVPGYSRIGGTESQAPATTGQGVKRIGEPDVTAPETKMPIYGGPGKSVAQGQLIPEKQLPQDELKYNLSDLQKQHSAALAERTPEGQEKADRIQAQIQDLQKSNPWGSAANHPGVLGRIGHIAEMVASRAPGIAPIMATIPGSEGYRAMERAGTREALDKDTQLNTQRQAEEGKETPKPKYAMKETLDTREGSPTKGQTVWAGVNENDPTDVRWSGAQVAPKEKTGAEAPANDTQIAEYTTQAPALSPALSPTERQAFSFPTGYKPTVKEINENKQLLAKANADKLAGNRDALEQTKQRAAEAKLAKQDSLNEQVAKDIAPMDASSLSRLKDITSMRSEDREAVYARAHELNPQFNTAEVDRRVKMLDDYTNGKSAQNIQSFGTFFEHAGNASQIVNDLRSRYSPKILNTPINALSKAGYGTDAVQISAALEPVRKEFEGFLLGGRALYADDRKAAETILSDSATPAQIQAALKVLAHTAQARYNEMNTRFKNTMKTDISTGVGPLSPEAYNAAGHLGVTSMGGMELKDGKQGYGWYPKE
jgi:hypothetical protein